MNIEELGHEAVNEVYTLVSAYIREERIAATYNVETLKKVQQYLADVLKNPDAFETFPKPDETANTA